MKNNDIILDLLFELAAWHGLAKLHLHTSFTISALESSTTRLGVAFRKFQDVTCNEFPMVDLPSEEAARTRRKAAAQKKAGMARKTSQGKKTSLQANLKEKGKAPATLRTFNLASYKLHSLGDYSRTIRLYGATDGYSTQMVRDITE